jgi:hypothetical protein
MMFFGGPMSLRTNVRLGVVVATAAAIVLAISASSARSEISTRDAQALTGASLIYVATIRKDGNQSKAAPVWFTVSGDSLLIQTGPDTWKAKRIKRGSPVLVWIGSATGPAFIGSAEITGDAAVQNKILDDFRKKYMENRVLGVGPSRARFDSGDRVAIKITPAKDLPDGFSSAPGTPPPPAASSPAPSKSP